MSNSTKQSLEGIGLGLITGLVIGISESDWLRVLIALSLIAFALKTLNVSENTPANHSYRIAFLGISSFLSVLFGLYIHEQQIFKPSPKDEMAYWLKAGFTPAQAREQWMKQKAMSLLSSNTTDTKSKTIIQSFSSIISPDSSATLSLSARLDSLQALVNQFSTGNNVSMGAITGIKEKVSKNLFSSSLSEKLCPRIDPDASSNAKMYFETIKNTEVEELINLTLKDTAINAETRYVFAKLLWDVICTVESDKSTDWLKITNTEMQDAESMEKAYNSQINPGFGKVADWISKNAKDKIAYYAMLYALFRRL